METDFVDVPEEEIDDLEFYSESMIDLLLEQDELSSEEAAFMQGYEA